MNRLFLIPIFAVLVAVLGLWNYFETPFEKNNFDNDSYRCETSWTRSDRQFIELRPMQRQRFSFPLLTSDGHASGQDGSLTLGYPTKAPDEPIKYTNEFFAETQTGAIRSHLWFPKGVSELYYRLNTVTAKCKSGAVLLKPVTIEKPKSLKCHVNGLPRMLEAELLEKNQKATLLSGNKEFTVDISVRKEGYFLLKGATSSETKLSEISYFELELPVGSESWTLQVFSYHKKFGIACGTQDSQFQPLSIK